MSKKIVSLVLALLMTLCTFSALAQSFTVTDMFGKEITIDGTVERVVALTAADCEILCALGCEDKLVGRGMYCDYPSSILEVPVVQSGAETNLEEILALNPQVVITSDMAQSKELSQMLENSGVKVVTSNADNLEEVYVSIRLIGAVLGREAEAENLIAEMQNTFADIAAKSENTGKTIYFEVSPLQYGLWAAGSGTFMDELAGFCGLSNAFADVADWGSVSEEQVLVRDPDYIVTITMYFGEGPTPVEEITSRPGWEGLKAVVNGHVFGADSNAMSRPGPRLKDAALELYRAIYGE